MKAYELTSWLEKKYPADAAEDWDNVGLLTGDDTNEISHVFLALDLTEETLAEAIEDGADMIITHHPMIFSGIKKINNHSFTGRKIIKLIRNEIVYYAMHTNYDVLGMAKLAGDILELEEQEVLEASYFESDEPEGIGRVGVLSRPMNLQECCDFVKEKLKLEHVKVFGDVSSDQTYQRLAVSPGSGKSMIGAALEKQAQVLVTGDIDHHAGIDAVAQGVAIIDAGHYGTEYIFMEDVKTFLEEKTRGIEIKTEMIEQPFHIL